MTSYELILDDEALTPYLMLMPASWPHPPSQLVRPLIAGLTLDEIPLVTPTYFLGTPGHTDFRRINLRTEFLDDQGWERAPFEAAAHANLLARPATWKRLDLGSSPIALCDDDYLAAERILDPAFLRQGAQAIGARGPLLAVLPRRGHLFLTAMAADPVHLRTFAGLGRKMCDDAGVDGLTPWPYLVDEGQVGTVFEIE